MMKIFGPNLLAIMAATLMSGCVNSPANNGAMAINPADSVFLNGDVYTVDSDHEWVSAIAVKNGKIIAVGDDNQVQSLIGTDTDVVDLEGRMVIPGMHDAHSHIELVGKTRTGFFCEVPADSTSEQFVNLLKGCEEKLGPGEWLIGAVYNPTMFPDEVVDRSFLDMHFPDRPVYVLEHSWHHGVANTKAMEIADVTDETPDPQGGVIVHDADGRATGEFLEKAGWLVLAHAPATPSAAMRKAAEWVVEQHNRYGVTSIQDASTSKAMLETLDAMDRDGDLTLDVAAHLVWDFPVLAGASKKDSEALIENRAQYASRHVATDFVKIIVDGSPMLPHSTQADLDPETGEIPVDRLLTQPPALNEAVRKFDAAGIKVKMHAVGSAAARAALDAIEYARSKNGQSGLYHEIAHSVWLSDEDIPRPAKLGAIVEMSPAIWHKGWPGMEEAFDFAAHHEQGSIIIVGTDWVILPDPNLMEPLEGMLNRPGLSVDLPTALRILTLNGAISVDAEDSRGSITVGKFANFAVLDQNLFEIPVDTIGDVKVVRTVFEGKTVFKLSE